MKAPPSQWVRLITTRDIAKLLGCERSYVVTRVIKMPGFPAPVPESGKSRTPRWDYHSVQLWIAATEGVKVRPTSSRGL